MPTGRSPNLSLCHVEFEYAGHEALKPEIEIMRTRRCLGARLGPRSRTPVLSSLQRQQQSALHLRSVQPGSARHIGIHDANSYQGSGHHHRGSIRAIRQQTPLLLQSDPRQNLHPMWSDLANPASNSTVSNECLRDWTHMSDRRSWSLAGSRKGELTQRITHQIFESWPKSVATI
jgi:hypothetical protein